MKERIGNPVRFFNVRIKLAIALHPCLTIVDYGQSDRMPIGKKATDGIVLMPHYSEIK